MKTTINEEKSQMFVRYVLAVLLVFMCVGESAQAQSGDGNELLRKCSAGVKAADGKTLTERENIDATWCVGYLHGVSDMHAILTAMGAQPLACFPEEVSMGEEARIVVKFLEAHPEWLHMEGRLLVVRALNETFACSSTRERKSSLGISMPFKNLKILAKPSSKGVATMPEDNIIRWSQHPWTLKESVHTH